MSVRNVKWSASCCSLQVVRVGISVCGMGLLTLSVYVHGRPILVVSLEQSCSFHWVILLLDELVVTFS